MFKTRLLSGILLVIIALITVITGGSLLFGVLLLISLIGMTELYKVFGIEKKAPGVLGYIFAVGYYALLYFKPQLPGESLNWFMMLFMGYLICQMAVLVFAYPKYNTQQIRLFRGLLCGSDAFLYLSDENPSGRYFYSMACLCMLMGMRYVCLLCGNADRKA
jgi:CDP-diglyceride synthetase